MSYVYPNCVAVVQYEGGRVRLNPEQRWDSDDPFVKARPGFFSSESVATAHSAGFEPGVEQATRAPGEKRSTRRPRTTPSE
jgi:hypothetical protein